MVYSYKIDLIDGSNGPFNIYESDTKVGDNVHLPFIVNLKEWKANYIFRFSNLDCGKITIKNVAGFSTTTTALFTGSIPLGTFTTNTPAIQPTGSFTSIAPSTFSPVTIDVTPVLAKCYDDSAVVDINVHCDYSSGQYELRIETTTGTVVLDWLDAVTYENNHFELIAPVGVYHFFVRDKNNINIVGKQLFFNVSCPQTTTTSTTIPVNNNINLFCRASFSNNSVVINTFLVRDGNAFATPTQLTVQGKLFFSDNNNVGKVAPFLVVIPANQSSNTLTLNLVNANSGGYLESCLSSVSPGSSDQLKFIIQTVCSK